MSTVLSGQEILIQKNWFFNVEKIAAEIIGRETVTYVANINKYYVSYRLYFEKNLQRKQIIKSLRATPKGSSVD